MLAVHAGHLGYRMGCRTYRPVYICVLWGIPVDARSEVKGWIPAFAGMTRGLVGMTRGPVGVT